MFHIISILIIFIYELTKKSCQQKKLHLVRGGEAGVRYSMFPLFLHLPINMSLRLQPTVGQLIKFYPSFGKTKS